MSSHKIEFNYGFLGKKNFICHIIFGKMKKQNLIQITREFPSTHFFVYRKKQFPFNFDLFKLASPVFLDNEDDNKSNKDILLLSPEEESNIDISDESIYAFIKYVQREPISIEEDNVLSLNYLGRIYQINELIESTKEYIAEHQSGLVLDIFSKEINENDNMITYEEIITENFLDYINDSRILNFPLPTIYRIFCKFQQNKHIQKDDQNQHKSNDQIFNFLIKCLDKYGREASVLFGELDADETKSQYLNVLLNKYSKSFDFHFLNSNMVKKKYELENEILFKIEKNSMDQNEVIEKLTKDVQKLIQNQEEQAKTINELKTKLKMYEKEFKKQTEINNEFDKNIQTVQYDNNQLNRFNGILTKLGQGNAMDALSNGIIDITVSSVISSRGCVQPKNVLNYGNDLQVFESKHEPNSWLCIDFKDNKVNPSHYSIKTTKYGNKDNHIPQNWDIEGSNDHKHWDLLDSRRKEESIHKAATANTFAITNSANKHNYYKYLRIIQRGKNTGNDDDLFFSSIEFFGNYIF